LQNKEVSNNNLTELHSKLMAAKDINTKVSKLSFFHITHVDIGNSLQ